jgi:hypothetical protein
MAVIPKDADGLATQAHWITDAGGNQQLVCWARGWQARGVQSSGDCVTGGQRRLRTRRKHWGGQAPA